MKTLPLRAATPKISLPDECGNMIDLAKLKSKAAVVFFYPKDSTPGCTVEAKGFSKNLAKFKKLGVDVFGVSGGSIESKAKFCEKSKLNVTLLADEDLHAAKKFGVYGPKTFMGRKFNGIHRTTFVIAKNKVVKVFDAVSPEGHPAEVLDFLKTYLGANKTKAPKKQTKAEMSPKKRAAKRK